MKDIYNELWKLPEDTLSLASDNTVPGVTDDAVTEEMNYLKNDEDDVSYSEIKYEETSDITQVLESNVDYKNYALNDSDRVIKDDVRYISMKYICRYLNRTAEWVEDRRILHNLFYMVDSSGEKLYREDEILSRMKFLGIEFRRVDLPYSQFSREEAAEYLGISQSEFEEISPDIYCKSEVLDSGETFSIYYKKDLDKAYRRHYFIKILADASVSIASSDIKYMLEMHGAEFADFKRRHPMAVRKSMDTRSCMRFCSEDVKCYIDEHANDNSIYKPTPKLISADMARVYCSMPRIDWLHALYIDKTLKPVRDSNGRLMKIGYLNVFDIDVLDAYIENEECVRFYGVGREFINRKHIKNRYGVNDNWIDTFVKNSDKVRIKLSNNTVVTWAYYRDTKPSSVIIGINYSDVENLIKEGHFIDVTHDYVIKKLKIDKENNKKRFKQAKHSIIASHIAYVKSKRMSPFVYNKVDADSVALSIESKINEERLILEEKKRLIQKIYRERNNYDNKLRQILGLTEKKEHVVQSNRCVRDMDTPQIFMCVNCRGKTDIFKQFKFPFITYNYVHSVEKYYTRTNKEKQSISMKTFCSGMSHMIRHPFRVVPSWFVFMDSTTYISDLFFKDKLEALPSDVGAVGVYGWKSLDKSYDWHKSDDTYGFYDTYSINDGTTKKIVGKNGFGDTTDVTILGGPVIAIRGSLVYDLLKMKYLHGYRIGDDHIGAIVSMYTKMCRKRVCVIDSSCTCCSDYSEYIGNDEWNDDQIQFVMNWDRELRKIIRKQYGCSDGDVQYEGGDCIPC